MTIQHWLGDQLDKTGFVAEYYGKLPFARREGGLDHCHLGSWETLGELLPRASTDLMVVRRNQRYQGADPTKLDDARELIEQGYTILVRHAERYHSGLAELANRFVDDFGAAVYIHLYATPGGEFGFGWHYDCEEVFILQTVGCKEYSLRKNTVHPWPLEETIPADMRYDRELMPLMRCRLAAGDWLYIPNGYWHRGDARETALSLAIGVMAPAAIDYVDFLRRHLLDSLLWRQRLPVQGEAADMSPDEQVAHLRALGKQLASDLARICQDDQAIRDWLSREVPRVNEPAE